MTFWMGVQKTRKERTIIIIMLAFAFGSACLHFHRRKKNISFSETYDYNPWEILHKVALLLIFEPLTKA